MDRGRELGFPPDVIPITNDAIERMGVNWRTGELHWEGQRVTMDRRLAWPERILAGLATASALVIAVIEFGRTFWGWSAGGAP